VGETGRERGKEGEKARGREIQGERDSGRERKGERESPVWHIQQRKLRRAQTAPNIYLARLAA